MRKLLKRINNTTKQPDFPKLYSNEVNRTEVLCMGYIVVGVYYMKYYTCQSIDFEYIFERFNVEC